MPVEESLAAARAGSCAATRRPLISEPHHVSPAPAKWSSGSAHAGLAREARARPDRRAAARAASPS
ncbi:MAG: hypothetical protein MZW92_49730 [Comamonadaceae bacterium]|nr:hypothetical protein [Comamonadaceae bacterium]